MSIEHIKLSCTTFPCLVNDTSGLVHQTTNKYASDWISCSLAANFIHMNDVVIGLPLYCEEFALK